MISTANANEPSRTKLDSRIYGWLCTGCKEVFTLEKDLAAHLKTNRGTCNLKTNLEQPEAVKYRCLNFQCGSTWTGSVTDHYRDFDYVEDIIPPLIQESFKNGLRVLVTYYCPLCTKMWVLDDDLKESRVLSQTYPKHQIEAHGKKIISCRVCDYIREKKNVC